MAIALDRKKQIWLLGGVIVMLVLAYFMLRYLPKHRELSQLGQQLQAVKAELASPRYPDVPDEDADELQEQATALELEVAALGAAMAAHLDGWAGGDDQDMILRVSEIARASGVKVTENVPFTMPKAQPANQKAAPAATAAVKGSTKSERKRLRKERRAGAASGVMQTGIPEAEGTLLYKLVNDFEEPRPMQAMTLEGHFFDIRNFFQSLSSMPSQVTVVRMDISTKTDVLVQGMPQVLQVKMILAM